MATVLAALVLSLTAPFQSGAAYYAAPLEELELASGQVLPNYGGMRPWEQWGAGVEGLPWAALDGDGEAVFAQTQSPVNATTQGASILWQLHVHTEAARDVTGSLFLPKASGSGFLRLTFRLPAARATSSPREFQKAELARALHFLRLRVPGAAWFRHVYDERLRSLGAAAPPAEDPERTWFVNDFRDPSDALDLFSGGRALYENLQLERGLPASAEGEETVALDSLAGLQVRAIDWSSRLGAGETPLDALAALVPADQHGLFFPSFKAFLDVLGEADRLGTFGLQVFEERSGDALTRQRYEKQLALELSAAAHVFGPVMVSSMALTGSDPYLRTGSDLALLMRGRSNDVVHGYVATRQDAAAGEHVSGTIGACSYRGVVDATRSVSSYVAKVGDAVVVTNSLAQLERIAKVAEKAAPALDSTGEYRFFRRRYPLGAEGESALLVLPDEAIRRWCSPRWRIASARLARAASALAEEHAAHLTELLAEPLAPRDLGVDPAFARLGTLRLTPQGVHSAAFGTLDFLRPVVELPLERVTGREAALYKTWREGYERAWSNFFDPIGARMSVSRKRASFDLTVMPLILDTQYADLRRMTGGQALDAASGDPHPEALVSLVMGLDPEWEPLKSFGSTLGGAGEKLGVDLIGWLGRWVSVYADEGPFWDGLVEAEDLHQALEEAEADLNEIPLALEVAVANPLKLALFMTGLRAFADGTAPGMTEWKERVAGERRFVEITSPGLGEKFSLFYATTPTALILSLHEPTLLAAMGREEARRAGGTAVAGPWAGAHAGLELRGRGVEVLEAVFSEELGRRMQRQSWANLPILNEWRRLFPERDPLALHERVFRERLACPGGGTYAWNEAWQTFESSVFGHPGEPKLGARRPVGWDALAAARFALELEPDGLRVRAEIERE